ncbi:cysteinyl-tRNA synthetase [Coprinopsis marcescibilis]|uniref:cysteine--tRNA ligase n=1 Tax=Coprinopsis marcescibilis TaxID=230819 RepID=A0A5C3KYZ1_COPMA|nr:cysteinyl-tRNA synthetase [Coprinopsis marcescibilis]
MALENRDPPTWTPPRDPVSSSTPLVLYNSLTRTKSPFVPVDASGRKVTWYCCGPTVYDAGHLGHARNYLTTDVLRRIMRDYFGYEVEFVQNVTDVDDKIIKRARERHFFNQYKLEHPKLDAQVFAETRSAFDKFARNTKGFPFDTVSIDQVPEWMLSQKELLENPILDEDQTIFKVRILALDSVANALRSAPNEGSMDPEKYWSMVDSVLSVYLGDVKKGDISPEQHAIFADYAAYWENHFNEDLRTLNILPPTVTTRVSEYIPENIAFVEQIIDNGFAYAIPGGTVYFDVNAFEKAGHYYAKLEPGNRKGDANQEESVLPPAPVSQDQAQPTVSAADAEIENEKAQKRSPRDFALWKKSRVGEPGWESPWGYGRPGWHIECSAMASQVLGAQFDVHSGGIDLAFPHHDNELAQAEAYWHKDPKESAKPVQWVNYFIHMGHLSIAGSKMSKSLKNFVTIRDAIATGDWTARKLRILFMLGGWKGGLEISQNFRAEVDLWEKTVSNFFSNVEALTRESESSDGPRQKHLFRPQEKQLRQDLEAAQKQLHASLCDSFNTGPALSAILDLIGKTNTYLKNNQKSASNPTAYFSLAAVQEVARWVTKMLQVFGLSTTTGADAIGWGVDSSTGSDSVQNKESIALPYVQVLSRFRDEVKALAIANKSVPVCQDLLKLSDSLRDGQLLQLGVALEDRDSSIGEQALIKFGDPAELIAAREAKFQAQLEKEAKKQAAKAEAERLEKEKAEKAKLRPQDMFRTEEYSEWDEDGVPTKDSHGEEVTKSKKKTLKKAWDKQKKLYDSSLALAGKS